MAHGDGDYVVRRRRDTYAMINQFMETKGLRMDYSNNGEYNQMERIKQLQIIKEMAISLDKKRKLREHVFERMPDVASRSCAAYFHKQKVNLYRFHVKNKRKFREIGGALTLWKGAFKTIEGHFGSGVLSYFVFLKHLLLTNLGLSILIILFAVIPMALFPETQYNEVLVGNSVDTSEVVSLAVNCSKLYEVPIAEKWYEYIINVLQGTGFMERSLLFYGYYADKELDFTSASYNYNMPFAYITCTHLVFIISLAVMVTLSAKGFRERMFIEDQFRLKYFIKTMLAWDYSMNNEKTVLVMHNSIFRNLNDSLDRDREEARRKSRTRRQLCGVWTVRVLINLIVVVILGASSYLIYYTTVKTTELTNSAFWSSYHLIIQFLVQYMTSVTITILNIVIPIVFKKLIIREDYSAATTINIMLARTVFLRLASVAVVLFSLYVSINCSPKDNCNVGTDTCTSIVCWETYAGQEFYKLALMDFFSTFFIIFLLEFPRRLIVTKCHCKLSDIIGLQEFDLSGNVLCLVYSEILMWVGLLFCPLLPAITTIKNFLVFYLRKLSTLKNYCPSTEATHASESEHFFQVLLLTSFTGCLVPVLYIIWRMTPSKGCGPFRVYAHMIDVVSNTINTWPATLRTIISFVTSAGIVIALLIVLILVIHYLSVSVKAHKDMVKILRVHVQLESQDKQFLLSQMTGKADAGDKMKAQRKQLPKDIEAQRTIPGNTVPGAVTENDDGW